MIQRQLDELGMEGLEERLRSATELGPGPNPFAFSQKLAEVVPVEGRPLLVLELSNNCGDDSSVSPEELAEKAEELIIAGADGISVRVDDSASEAELGMYLFHVCRKVAGRVPVFARDWFLHPLQVVEAKAAGCTGCIGVVASVTGPKGTPVLSSFGAALGLDIPVEVVNITELQSMEKMGVPFYAMNISVGLSVGIVGFSNDVVRGVLGELPFGALSIVGISEIDKAASARSAGADALYVRGELVNRFKGSANDLIQNIRSLVDGDD